MATSLISFLSFVLKNKVSLYFLGTACTSPKQTSPLTNVQEKLPAKHHTNFAELKEIRACPYALIMI